MGRRTAAGGPYSVPTIPIEESAVSEPPPVPGPVWKPATPEPSAGDNPGDTTAYLLVMPATDGAPAGMPWPGPEGRPAGRSR